VGTAFPIGRSAHLWKPQETCLGAGNRARRGPRRPRARLVLLQSERPVTHPSEALWRSGGPLLALATLGWLLLGVVVGALAAVVLVWAVLRVRRPPSSAPRPRTGRPAGEDPDAVAADFLLSVAELPGVEAA